MWYIQYYYILTAKTTDSPLVEIHKKCDNGKNGVDMDLPLIYIWANIFQATGFGGNQILRKPADKKNKQTKRKGLS